MGRGFKFEKKTKTTTFRIPVDLFEDTEEYKHFRMQITEYIEQFYEEFKEQKFFQKHRLK